MPYKLVIFTSLVFASSSLLLRSAKSYPQVEMTSCSINAMKSSPGSTYRQVTNYCDCALTEVIDKRKDFATSTEYCYRKHFN